jgi:predicted DNA-binding protein YlxM (UPF0122 family)
MSRYVVRIDKQIDLQTQMFFRQDFSLSKFAKCFAIFHSAIARKILQV